LKTGYYFGEVKVYKNGANFLTTMTSKNNRWFARPTF